MKKITSNIFVRGGVLLTVSSVVVNVSNYLFYVLTAKTIGPRGYGEIVTLFSYLTILSIPFSTIPSLLIRRLGYAGGVRLSVAKSFESWFLERLARWWFIIPLFFLVTFIIPPITNLRLSTSIILIFAVVVGVVASVYFSLLQGLRLFKESSILSVLTAFLKLSGVILVFFGLGSLNTIYVGIGISISIGVLYSYMVIKSLKVTSEKTTYTFKKGALSLITNRATLLTSASLLGITLIGNADITIVKRVFSDTQAGMYGAWSLFAKTIFYVLGPVNTLALIYFSAQETQRNQKKVMALTLIVLLIIGIGALFAYSTFTNHMIGIVLSKNFLDIAPVIPSAAIFGILYAGVNIMNTYFVAKKDNAQLVGFLTAPIYIGCLLLFGKTMGQVILINIFYASLLMGIFIFVFIRSNIKSYK
ncbi:hypothetical protein A2690_05205 [Candidatus Roizmanbacteria bacterium RIFCSPHIGHO2_01_FULL_39_12b]|uniref:Polysaccharide biosynthesis protein C-terminal domain-containing protein n=1 Tax=Candidatus Roizmanbacteria bacterium RIFCSPHIGHO2_01_FULL_39_12b TaxID=1802030 RepID=A0A1F7G933_9BACT|nr:MAG: hypothetical protein A2690_05205 [Candidatus Roizmanbacteria bacterium RIFCSPHIGHO2_01_FULL_39_12b]